MPTEEQMREQPLDPETVKKYDDALEQFSKSCLDRPPGQRISERVRPLPMQTRFGDVLLVAGEWDPTFATPESAGLDLVAAETKLLRACVGMSGISRARIRTTAQVALPIGHYGLICGRSGLAAAGIMAHTGVIDADYRGVIHMLLENHSEVDWRCEPGDRIGQLVLVKYTQPAIIKVQPEELPTSSRGTAGLGSTGK